MTKIEFTKMVASGNDFVVIENSPRSTVHGPRILARRICDRKYGIGADGLLLLEKSHIADVRMRIFNSDGSEAEMCGNGARCVALSTKSHAARRTPHIKIETKAGIIESEVKGENVRIKLTDPANIRLNIPLEVNRRNLKANFIYTGVPHAVIFVEGIDEIHVTEIGREIRNHKKFAPSGTNVDFVEILRDNYIEIRTYERGVEDETLACGTGAVASALMFVFRYSLIANKVKVLTKSREVLEVYFDKTGNHFTNVWLKGKASIVCKGEYYV